MAKQPSEKERLIGRAEELHVFPEFTGTVPRPGGGQRLAALQAAVVRFMDISQPGARPEFIHGPLFAAVMSMNEKGGRWLRAAEHRAHVVNGVVVVGGSGGASEKDAKGGLWTVIAVDHPSDSADGVALQRAALNQTFYRSELPAGVRAIPEGLFKDMRAGEDLKVSLWSNHFLYRAGNRRLRRALKIAYVQMADQVEKGTMRKRVQLKAPKIWSTPADGEPLHLRWRDARDPDLASRTLDFIDNAVAMRIQRGNWAVDGFPQLLAGIGGSVAAVEKHSVTLRDTEGNEVTVVMPVTEFRQHVQQITGFDASDMPAMPLVDVGRVIGPNTCLFGPAKPMMASAEALRASLGREKDEKRRAQLTRGLHLCRLWAVLAESRQHEGRSLYPTELVAPQTLDQVYFQVAGSERTPWDRSVQRIALERRSEKCLRNAGVGFSFDIYSTSHRAESDRHLAVTRERRKNSKPNAAPTGKQGKKQPKPAKEPAKEPEKVAQA